MSWVTPPPAGNGFKPSEYFGALVFVRVLEFLPNQTTQFGVRNGIRANVTVVDFPRDPSKRGEAHPDSLIWGTVLVDQLAGIVGQLTLGRLDALPGRNANPATILNEPTEADNQLAQAFAAQHPEVMATPPPVAPATPAPQFPTYPAIPATPAYPATPYPGQVYGAPAPTTSTTNPYPAHWPTQPMPPGAPPAAQQDQPPF
jgi:hypothetical protein